MSIDGFGGCTLYISVRLFGGFDAGGSQAITKGSTLPHVISQHGYLEDVRLLCSDGAKTYQAMTGDRTPAGSFSGNDCAQANQQNDGALPRRYGALARLYGALLRLYGALPRLYGALARLYGALPRLYGALARHRLPVFVALVADQSAVQYYMTGFIISGYDGSTSYFHVKNS